MYYKTWMLMINEIFQKTTKQKHHKSLFNQKVIIKFSDYLRWPYTTKIITFSMLTSKTESFCNIGYPELCSFCLNNNCFLRLTYFYEYVNTLKKIWREIQYVSVTLVKPRFESSTHFSWLQASWRSLFFKCNHELSVKWRWSLNLSTVSHNLYISTKS